MSLAVLIAALFLLSLDLSVRTRPSRPHVRFASLHREIAACDWLSFDSLSITYVCSDRMNQVNILRQIQKKLVRILLLVMVQI